MTKNCFRPKIFLTKNCFWTKMAKKRIFGPKIAKNEKKIEKFSKIQIGSIFSNFKETYKSEFLSYDCDQVVKKHLNYSNNSLIKIIWARAWLRARCTPQWKTQEKRIFKHFCNTCGRGRGFRARNRARPCNARQWILPKI